MTSGGLMGGKSTQTPIY